MVSTLSSESLVVSTLARIPRYSHNTVSHRQPPTPSMPLFQKRLIALALLRDFAVHQDEETVTEKRDYSKEFEYGEKFDFPESGVPTYDSIARRAPPLTIPLEAHTNPNSRDHNHSSFSPHSSSPTDDSHSSHSRTSSMRSEYESPEVRRGSPTNRTKKTWVIE